MLKTPVIHFKTSHNKPLALRLSMSYKRTYGLGLDQRTFMKQRIKKQDVATWSFSPKEEALDFLTIDEFQETKPSRYLQRLHLNYLAGISSKSFKDMSQYLKEFILLKTLSLNLSLSNGFTNLKMHHVNEGLKRIFSLENLELCFSGWCDSIDEKLDILRKGLRRHISLRSFSLSFSQCFQISNLTIRNLCKDLKNLVFLQRLRMDFPTGNSITNEGLRSFNGLLKKLKNLHNASFNLKDCSKVSLLGVGQIFQGLNTPNSSQTMKINYSGYSYQIMLSDFEEISKREISLQMTFHSETERLSSTCSKMR